MSRRKTSEVSRGDVRSEIRMVQRLNPARGGTVGPGVGDVNHGQGVSRRMRSVLASFIDI